MAIYALGTKVPQIDPDAYVHPDACIIGDVTLGPGATVWPGAILRGDSSYIVVGARTSVQDGAVIHCATGEPTTIGENVVIGHLAHLEGCTVGDGALIGTASVVLNLANIGAGSLVGAQALVPGGVSVPARARALGVPVKITEDAVPEGAFALNTATYVARGMQYREGLRRLDG